MTEEKTTTKSSTSEEVKTKPSYVYIVIQNVLGNFNILDVFSTKAAIEKNYPNLKGKGKDCDRNGNGLFVFKEKLN